MNSSKRKGRKPLPHSKVKLGTGATIAQWTINECVLTLRIDVSWPCTDQWIRSNSNLSLVALLRPHAQDQHSALIDYNVATFRQAVLAIFEVGARGGRGE